MLILDNITVRFPAHTIEGSFKVKPGQGIALMGESGSGKSTLLNVIAGFQTPDSGTLAFNGESLLKLSPADRPITMLFQENNLFSHLSVAQNIGLGLHPGLKLSEQDQHTIDEALTTVGLENFQARNPRSLSGGQKQRVALARCLVRKRPILLLDEPFKGLDDQRAQQLIELTHKIVNDQKLVLVVATHSQLEADVLCGQRLVLGGVR